MRIKVLSWNIWGGKNIEGIIDFLKTVDIDVIALQEVIQEEYGNTALTIARRLGGYGAPLSIVAAPDMKISSKWTGPIREKEETLLFGNAILTKHTILKSDAHELSSGESRIALSADIKIQDFVVHIWNVHLKHLHMTKNNSAVIDIHNGQADRLLTLIPKEKTIVMGDFNSVPGGYAATKMKHVLRDAEKGLPIPTWETRSGTCSVCPADNSMYKLDYIFTSKDIEPVEFSVEDSNASDHLPILAIVEI